MTWLECLLMLALLTLSIVAFHFYELRNIERRAVLRRRRARHIEADRDASSDEDLPRRVRQQPRAPQIVNNEPLADRRVENQQRPADVNNNNPEPDDQQEVEEEFDEAPPELRISSATVPMLNRYDFDSWLDGLTFVLTYERSINAIVEPLPHEDPRNIAACTRIRSSVPIDLQEPIIKVRCAHQMIANLTAKYRNVDYLAKSELEQRIRSLKLTGLDEKAISAHLIEVRKQIQNLQLAGGVVTEAQKTSILASTLPAPEADQVDPWKEIRNSLSFGLIPYEQGMTAVRKCALDLSVHSTNLDAGKALAVRSSYDRRGGKTMKMNGPWRQKPKKCFACQGEGHFMSECEKFKMMFNKTEEKQYSKAFHSRLHYLDSGSSFHHLTSKTHFKSIEPVTGKSVIVANGESCPVEAVGVAELKTASEPLVLENAHFTPTLDANLVSVPQLTNEGFSVLFQKDKATVLEDGVRIEGKKVLEVPRVGDLYCHTEPASHAFCSKSPEEWHRSLGHPSEKKLQTLQKLHPELDLKHPKHCDTCVMAKQRQKPYPTTKEGTTHPLELIHVDLCDAKGTGYDKSKYFLLLMDEYSKYIEVFPLTTKASDAVLGKFISFRTRMEKQVGRSILKVRSDNGGEFLGAFEKYLEKHGIVHQLSVAYCHQQNGSAERAIQSIVSKSRCLLYDSCTPERYWPLAIKTAAFLYNLMPHSSLGDASPFKSLFSNAKDILDRGQRLHVFGSEANRWIHHERRDNRRMNKYSPTSEKWVFMGYDSLDNDAVVLLDPSRDVTIKERNVTIIDGKFPFCEKKDKCKCGGVKQSTAADSVPASPSPITLPQVTVNTEVLPSGGEGHARRREEPVLVEQDVFQPVPNLAELQVEPEAQQEAVVEPEVAVEPEPEEAVLIPEPVVRRPPFVFVFLREDRPNDVAAVEPAAEPVPAILPGEPLPELEPPIPQPVLVAPPPLLAIQPPPEPVQEQVVVEEAKPVPPPRTRRTADMMVIEENAVVDQRLRPLPHRNIAKLAVGKPAFAAEHVTIPEDYDKAMKSAHFNYWIEAQNMEFASLLKLNVFDEVPKEKDMKLITCKWVYDLKRTKEGLISKFKARLVARGFTQVLGVDVWETFAPTVLPLSIRTFLVVSKLKGFYIHQIDVTTAFLNGDIDGEIYVQPPAPFDAPGVVWKLKKSLYGLKQSPRCWSEKLKAILARIGFQPTFTDRCIFIRIESSGAVSLLLVYVDDILLATSNLSIMKKIKEQLAKEIEIKDMGSIGTFLGVDFSDDVNQKCITASQSRYIDELAVKFNLTNADPIDHLPPIQTLDFSKDEIDESLPVRSLIGGLLFISNMTRPDISSAMSYLSRYLDKPSQRVWKYTKQVLKYLMSTKHRPLVLGDLNGSNLEAFADANYAPHGDRKSQSGAVIKLAGSTIGWHSKKQKAVATSTCEAEYISLSIAVNKVLKLQNLLKEIHFEVIYPTIIHEDNQPAIAIVMNQRDHEAAKHVDVKYMAIQDYQLKGYILVKYIGTKKQLADSLTKVTANPAVLDQLLGPPDALKTIQV